MTDAKNASKPAIAARDFTDDGTGQSFLKDQEVVASVGAIANYRAAGLIAGDEPDAEVATDDKPGDDKATDGKSKSTKPAA